MTSNQPARPQGRVVQINISNGGVPKRPVTSTYIDTLGLAGDAHRDKVHHGGPERAVALFSIEVIEALRQEGHPIVPGSAGENLTISGLDWATVEPGQRLQVGNSVLLELTNYVTPCSNIAPSFIEGNFNRISVKRYPGFSRIYARVLQSGTVQVGDPVEVVTEDERQATSGA